MRTEWLRSAIGVVAATAFITAVFVGSGVANAGLEWCEDDPIFIVNGAQFKLGTGFRTSDLASVTSIAYTVDVPANATTRYVSPPGLGIAPEQVTFVRSQPDPSSTAFAVIVHVTVNASASFPVVVTLYGPGVDPRHEGNSNAAVTFTASLPLRQ